MNGLTTTKVSGTLNGKEVPIGTGLSSEQMFNFVPNKTGGLAGSLNGNQSATIDAVPKTINSPVQDFTVNRELLGLSGSAPAQPDYLTELPISETSRIKEKTASVIAGLKKDFELKVQEISKQGEATGGRAKAFLSKLGGLGTTVTGAPADTGLGALSDIVNKTNAEIEKEREKFKAAQNLANQAVETESAEALKELNSLRQQQFENALTIWNTQFNQALQASQEARALGADTRESEQALKDETMSNLNFMLQNFGPDILDKVEASDLNDIEEVLGLPMNTLKSGFQIVSDLEKIETDKKVKSSSFVENKDTGELGVMVLYEDGTSEFRELREGTPVVEEDKVLSVEDAKKLGVPYGTTESEAATLGITIGQESKNTTNTKTINTAQEKISLIDNLLNSPGFNSAVGPSFLTRGNKLNWYDKLTGNTQEFIGGVQQLISQDTLNTLLELKKGGGTLGALSDQERIMLQNAATKIGAWVIKDGNGNVVGYNVSEKAMRAELERIKSLAQKAIEEAQKPGQSINTLENYFNQYPEKRKDIEQLINDNPDLSDDDILQIINGGNQNNDDQFNW